MTPKQIDPADEKYEPKEPAGPDESAEEQEEARAMAVTHPGVAPSPPAPPAKGEGYPPKEGAPGYHLGPPERWNCPNCGHGHQPSITVCERCKKPFNVEKARADAKAAAAAA